jgi:hypothetical protein
MNFGKYLIEKGAVEKESFIQVAIKQANSQPSTLESLIETNVLELDKTLEVIFNSLDKGIDLLSSMRDLGVSDADITKVTEFQSSQCLNIVDTLVTDGYAQKDKVLELYEKYQSESFEKEEAPVEQEVDSSDSADNSIISAAALESLKELQGGELDMSEFQNVQEESTPVVEEVTVEDSVSTEEDVAISAAALESLRELGGVPESELEALTKVTETLKEDDNVGLEPSAVDYISIYDDKKNKKINKILDMIRSAADSDKDIANYFNSLFRELHVIKGAAVLVDAKYSKKLIEIWELIIDKIFTMSNPELKAWFHSYESCLKNTSSLLWEIREAVRNGQNEEQFMEDETARSKYLGNIGTLKKIITEIS